MEMDWDLKKLAPTFSSFNAMPIKSTKEKNIMVSACWFDILLVHNSTGEFCVWLKALSNDSNTEMT